MVTTTWCVPQPTLARTHTHPEIRTDLGKGGQLKAPDLAHTSSKECSSVACAGSPFASHSICLGSATNTGQRHPGFWKGSISELPNAHSQTWLSSQSFLLQCSNTNHCAPASKRERGCVSSVKRGMIAVLAARAVSGIRLMDSEQCTAPAFEALAACAQSASFTKSSVAMRASQLHARSPQSFRSCVWPVRVLKAPMRQLLFHASCIPWKGESAQSC